MLKNARAAENVGAASATEKCSMVMVFQAVRSNFVLILSFYLRGYQCIYSLLSEPLLSSHFLANIRLNSVSYWHSKLSVTWLPSNIALTLSSHIIPWLVCWGYNVIILNSLVQNMRTTYNTHRWFPDPTPPQTLNSNARNLLTRQTLVNNVRLAHYTHSAHFYSM